MRKSARLKAEARSAASFRGHVLAPFVHVNRGDMVHQGHRPVFQASCKHCGAWVQVETRPYPNGIEVGGSAVSGGCNA